MRPSLASTVCAFSLITIALSSEPDVTVQQPIAVTNTLPAEPQDGVIRRYSTLSSCEKDTERKNWQSSASYSTDVCHDLNPRLTESFIVSSPPICPNGTRAELVTFTNSGCAETSDLEPASATIVSDDTLGECVDVGKKWSFAFVCYGVETVGDARWGSFGMLAVMVGATLLAVGLGTTMMLYGSSVGAFDVLGLLSASFWTLGRMCLGIFKVPNEVLPEEEGEEKSEKVE